MAITLHRFMETAERRVGSLQRTTTEAFRTLRGARNRRKEEGLASFKYHVQKRHRRPYVASIHSRIDGATLTEQAGHVPAADVRLDGRELSRAGGPAGVEEAAATSDQAPNLTPVESTCRSARRCRARGEIARGVFHHGAPAQWPSRAPPMRSTVPCRRRGSRPDRRQHRWRAGRSHNDAGCVIAHQPRRVC
jgi:hypothetical protein